MNIEINFDDFMESNQSGKFVVNPYWLEYLLNLFYQGYLGEVWEEVMDTKINHSEMLENIAYGTIGANFDDDIKNIGPGGETSQEFIDRLNGVNNGRKEIQNINP